jgi:hypothetical protein
MRNIVHNIYRYFLLCLIAALAVASPNQAIVRYIDIGVQGQSKYLVADASGNLFVVSQIVKPSGQTDIRATKTDPEGNTLKALMFPRAFRPPLPVRRRTRRAIW